MNELQKINKKLDAVINEIARIDSLLYGTNIVLDVIINTIANKDAEFRPALEAALDKIREDQTKQVIENNIEEAKEDLKKIESEHNAELKIVKPE